MNRPSYLEVLKDTPDGDLLTEAMETDHAYREIRERRGQLNAEVLRRFPEGTQWIAGDVIAIKTPAFEPYQWYFDRLLEAFEGKVTKSQWEEMVYEEEVPAHVEKRFTSRAIMKYAKAAGVDLEGCFFRAEREPMLKYERDDLLEKLEASVAAIKGETA